MSKSAMTLSLTSVEMAAVQKMADDKGMSKTAVIRQALRLYEYADAHLSTGHEMQFRNTKTGKVKETIVVGCGWPEMD